PHDGPEEEREGREPLVPGLPAGHRSEHHRAPAERAALDGDLDEHDGRKPNGEGGKNRPGEHVPLYCDSLRAINSPSRLVDLAERRGAVHEHPMFGLIRYVVVLAFVVLPLARARAEDLYVYPDKGQTTAQLEGDKEACHDWAVKQTGVDPVKMANEPAPT